MEYKQRRKGMQDMALRYMNGKKDSNKSIAVETTIAGLIDR